MADLTYNIQTGVLKGQLNGVNINTKAGSGGRAGSKKANAVNSCLANNGLATHIGGSNPKSKHHFGPIPAGKYKLKIHESRSNWIRLIPFKKNIMFGRKGFAIHGRGNIGSHGCLVPEDFSVIKKIKKALQKNKGTTFTLEVKNLWVLSLPTAIACQITGDI